MATKAEITTLVNTNLADGSGIPAIEHRAVLHTDTDSVLEAIYPSEITEDEVTNTITTNNANFDYDVKIVKIGRQVTLDGTYENVSGGTLLLSPIFAIDLANTSYTPSTTRLNPMGELFTIIANGNCNVASEQKGCFITDTGSFIINSSIFDGEGGAFKITYNTLN